MRYELFPEDELRPGDGRAVRVGGVTIAVMRTPAGDYRALRDSCSHHGAPLSHGRLQPVTVGDDVGCYDLSTRQFVLRCPWHGYEFDTESGQCLADPLHERVRAYPVTVTGGLVFLDR